MIRLLTLVLLLLFTLSIRSEGRTRTVTLPVKETALFAEVIDKVRTHYFEDISDEALIRQAIVGMLSGLDPHSSYLDEEQNEDLQIRTQGRFGGLGIQVEMSESGLVRVISPIDDTPAYYAGVQPGDLISNLDDQVVKGLTLQQAVDIMRGEPGSTIRLTILREGTAQPLVLAITRAVIKVASVKGDYLGAQIGYIRITNFQTSTAQEVQEMLDTLVEENGRLDGVVLDLRNNPGGVLQGAIDVSDIFLERGTIVYTEGRNREAHFRANAKSPDYLNGLPLVVIINGGSASASEIVAGALQDHKRALILGTRSFGKGSVQTLLPLSQGEGKAAIKLTTALYYTPNGRSIQAEGIAPDVVIEAIKAEKIEDQRVSERNLSGHLENDASAVETEAMLEEDTNRSASAAQRLDEDYQLQQAVHILRGITILNGA